MADDVREFFEGLPARVGSERVAGMRNSYAFDIDGAGAWTVRVADGTVDVRDGLEQADCTISVSEQTFRQIIGGDQNPTSAYMTGKLKVKGDMGAAMKLQKLF